MKLKPDVDIAKFLQAVAECTDDILFITSQGDCLSLKSELSKYVFAVVVANQKIMQNSQIVLRAQQDLEHLKDYLTER